jgi:uncharacterized metal-binding protein
MAGKKVIVISCSGIGKPIGTISRETAYEIVRLRPEVAETLCLAALTSGDKETIKKVNDNYCIALDGCAKHCAQKNTQYCGKDPDKSYMLLKFAATNPDKKPEGIADTGEGGKELIKIITKEIISDLDEMVEDKKKLGEGIL